MGYPYTKNVITYLKFKFDWMSYILSNNAAEGSIFYIENHRFRTLGIMSNSELFKKGLTLITFTEKSLFKNYLFVLLIASIPQEHKFHEGWILAILLTAIPLPPRMRPGKKEIQ